MEASHILVDHGEAKEGHKRWMSIATSSALYVFSFHFTGHMSGDILAGTDDAG
jgi:hypothetical protein